MAENDIGQFLDYGQQAIVLVQQMQEMIEQFDEDAIRNDVVATVTFEGDLWLLHHDALGGKFALTTDELIPPAGKYRVEVTFDAGDETRKPTRVLAVEAATGRVNTSSKRQSEAEAAAKRILPTVLDERRDLIERCRDRWLVYNFAAGMRRALSPCQEMLGDIEDLRVLYLEWQLPPKARPIFHQLRMADPDMDPEDHANAAREISK